MGHICIWNQFIINSLIWIFIRTRSVFGKNMKFQNVITSLGLIRFSSFLALFCGEDFSLSFNIYDLDWFFFWLIDQTRSYTHNHDNRDGETIPTPLSQFCWYILGLCWYKEIYIVSLCTNKISIRGSVPSLERNCILTMWKHENVQRSSAHRIICLAFLLPVIFSFITPRSIHIYKFFILLCNIFRCKFD